MYSKTVTLQMLRRKKMLILFCGVAIFFLTSMAKVIIPSTIFQDLLQMGMPVDRIASLGAAFLYSYAASQLFMGCFSDRCGGVRILLIGGTLFSAGTVIFPLMDNYYLMILLRIISGFGAGTIFLGVAKLLNDLFPGKFGTALGIVLLFSYLGPTTGTVPMVKLVAAIGWKAAMIAPGIAAACPLLVIFALRQGTVKPMKKGQTLEPLLITVKNKNIWLISFACAAVYGTYYAIVGQLGQKIITDIYKLTPTQGSLCIMLLTLIVASNNMGGTLFLKLVKNRRKTVILTGVIFTTCGILLGRWALLSSAPFPLFLVTIALSAYPAGLFPIFSIVAKEVNPPEIVGMSVAFLNFMAFVFISLYQNVAGVILKAYPPQPGALSFPTEAYGAVYLFFIIGAAVSLTAASIVPETRPKA